LVSDFDFHVLDIISLVFPVKSFFDLFSFPVWKPIWIVPAWVT
jgi:hypothetical protein